MSAMCKMSLGFLYQNSVNMSESNCRPEDEGIKFLRKFGNSNLRIKGKVPQYFNSSSAAHPAKTSNLALIYPIFSR